MEGQSSAFAATVDPELVGIAVRVASPQPLLLPNGFLWEFEVCASMDRSGVDLIDGWLGGMQYDADSPRDGASVTDQWYLKRVSCCFAFDIIPSKRPN
jgi:hypothetical protein